MRRSPASSVLTSLRAIGLKACIDEVAKSIAWGKKQFKPSTVQGSTPEGRKTGKGIACMIKATITPSISCAVVKMNEDASLSIYAGTVEMGQGSETTLAQIAGKEPSEAI